MSTHTPPLKRESSDERKLAIAQAARELIIEKGFEGLRTRDIAERVGINIATLHYHVPTKNALIALVAETIRDQFSAQSARRPRTGLSPLVQLRMEFEDQRETLLETPDLIVLMTELIQRARRDAAVECVMRPLYDYWVGQFVEIYAAGRLDGTFRPDIDPVAAANITTGAVGDHWRQSDTSIALYDRIAAELERAFLNPVSSKD
ncbi:TetR/AcrR family transcriptional regulator [Devosia sp.]|uniref:TetR/AcrR family transcriptional regulator n=1 Tax=Devosia sp. TaxID=1871048 RepID=UPI0032630594